MPLFTRLAKRFLPPKQEALPGIEVPQKIQKEKERQGKKNSRWAIVIIFFLTVLASGFFWLKTELPIIWQKLFSPAVISTLPEKAVFEPKPVLAEIKGLTENLRGTYGVFIYRWKDGNQYGINQDEVFTAASLIKLPVMLAIYQEAEKGDLDLKKYYDELEAMGKRSDNAAFNRAVKSLGEAEIQAVIDSVGMKKTSFVDNDTTPADIGLFFQKLYQERLISKEHQEEFLNFLTDTIWEDRIPAGIPEGIRVAHKIGTETGSFSDAGIIFTQPPFILVIMSDGAREAEATEVLPRIARAAWEFEGSF